MVFDANSNPYGLTFAEWTAKWWQWAYSIPKDIHPAYDDAGRYCTVNQKGPVWFLPGSFGNDLIRQCTVPSDKSILFPILNSECNFAAFPNLKNEKQLRQCAKEIQDSVMHLKASVDGKNVTNLEDYRVQSPLFNFTLPENNIADLPPQTTQAVSDGNWVFLKTLSEGEHSFSFEGDLRNASNAETNASGYAFAVPYGWDNNVIYNLITTADSSDGSSHSLFSFNQTGAQNATKSKNTTQGNGYNNDLYLLADSIENRLEKVSAVLKLTGKLPEMRHTSFFSSHFNLFTNGIPSNADMEKRQIAKFLLSEYHEDIVSVLFLMPNGTVYMLEPYERQLNLTTSDLSFRDYYIGAINTKDAFLGNVITSASSGLKQAQLAVPVFDSEDNNTLSLKGILAAGLNFEVFNEMLQQALSLVNQDERILLVDGNGVKVADSNRELSYKNKSFANLQGFENAINGQSGSITETVDGTETSVSYHPVDAVSNTWAVLSLQQNGDAAAAAASSADNFSPAAIGLPKQKQ